MTRLGDRYLLGRQLGEGPSSEVYLATDLLLNREVAVKVLRAQSDAAAQRRALRAAQAAARLQVAPRNVVPVLDVQGGRPAFLVLGVVRGHRLSDILPARLPEEHARALADGVLSGLAALHEAGEVHRDVTPFNVLIDGDDTAVLTSAGLSEAAIDPGLGTRPADGEVRPPGTAPSPEQEIGLAATARSDVFAAARIVSELLPKPRPPIHRVLTRALAEDPQERYADGGEFHAALREAWPVGAAGADEEAEAPAELGPARTSRRMGFVAVLAAIALLAGAIFVLRDSGTPSAPAQVSSTVPPPVVAADPAASPTPTIEETALADIVAEAERNPDALGVGGQTLLPGLSGLDRVEGPERAADVASLYGATVVGAARGAVDPEFANRVVQALWPEVTVDSLFAWISENPQAAGERGPTLLGALRDLVSITDQEDRLTRGADLGLVAAEWAQERTLSPAVAVTALTALNGIQGGDAQRAEITVGIPTTQGYVDTGIDLPAGAVVIVVASGEVVYDGSSSSGPDGVINAPELRAANLIPQIDHAALLGRIGPEGEPFFVGSEAVFPVAEAGRLFLGINDEGAEDNEGAYQATVTVWGS